MVLTPSNWLLNIDHGLPEHVDICGRVSGSLWALKDTGSSSELTSRWAGGLQVSILIYSTVLEQTFCTKEKKTGWSFQRTWAREFFSMYKIQFNISKTKLMSTKTLHDIYGQLVTSKSTFIFTWEIWQYSCYIIHIYQDEGQTMWVKHSGSRMQEA